MGAVYMGKGSRNRTADFARYRAAPVWQRIGPGRTATIQDLGWANGWDEDPVIVARCRERREAGQIHYMFERPGDGRCVHVVTCRTCGYTYQYDSGD